MNREKSAALFEEAKQYFPGGVSSPVRAFKSVFGPPLFIESGSGAEIKDADGNTYIDFCCSWGPLILGHAHPAVLEAIQEAATHGSSFGAPTRWENRLGGLMIKHNRFLDKVRFVSSGTEAVMSAVRLARGYTGKDSILKFEGCYHGHVDALLVKAGSGLATFGVSTSAGIPAAVASDTLVLPLDDEEILEQAFNQHADKLAAVIIEPVPANNGLLLQRPEYLRKLRELCTKHKVLLIFDEVISGYRVGIEGAAGHYEITPDLLTFGKVIGGGMPVGAYGGKAEIMAHVSPEGTVYQAGTLSGNPVAMAAGAAQLAQCCCVGFYEELAQRTANFTDAIRERANAKGMPLKVFNIGSIFWLAFTELDAVRRPDQIDAQGMEVFKYMHRELLQRGIYIGPSGYEVGFVSAAHTDAQLERAAEAISDSLAVAFASDFS